MRKLILFSFISLISISLLSQNSINPEMQWSVYRGPHSSGYLDNANLPDTWDVTNSTNIKWTIDIPGLALSSPIIWGDNLFLTTAISSYDTSGIKTGIFGAGEPIDDDSEHDYKVYCINRSTGNMMGNTAAAETT